MKEIGKRIKQLRQKKNIPLKDLAAKTGLTSSFLSQLENAVTLPSIESLNKIAKALDTAIVCFFQKEESREFVFLKKESKGKGGIQEPLPNYEMLVSSVMDIKMLPLLMSLKKGEVMSAEFCPSGEEMLGVPLSGKTNITVNDKEHVLEPGDSIYLVRPRFGFLKNAGEEEAKFLWTVLRVKS